jgi:3-dehydroquinate synthase
MRKTKKKKINIRKEFSIMSKTIIVNYENKPCYPIEIRRDFTELLPCLQAVIPNLESKKVCIVSETNVAPYYLETVTNLIKDHCAKVVSHVFPAGEANKNLDTVSGVYQTLIENQFDRNDFLIALGGGVVGDLTGFSAATYLRGISFVQIPTTLLSQVDSSIGGKTGVDFQCYKNMVGAFHMPKLVYTNLATLNSLPKREFLSGMGEIIKHGLIKDASYYNWLKAHCDAIKSLDYQVLEEMIAVSDHIKQVVVEKDPKEKGERAHLNFGHTLGHSIEKLSDFSLLHGECVALGMVGAAYLSMKKQLITEAEYTDIRNTIADFELPVCKEDINPGEVAQTTKLDKKMDSGVVKFILLDQVGTAGIHRDVTIEDMTEAADKIKNPV